MAHSNGLATETLLCGILQKKRENIIHKSTPGKATGDDDAMQLRILGVKGSM
jgi:hypothetical protein